MRYLRKMRTWAGRLVRDIERKIEGQPDLKHACEPRVERDKQFLAQKPAETFTPQALLSEKAFFANDELPQGS
jgi:hypothetical protein